MNKRRILAMIVFSPILLALALALLVVACIWYAITGKWELKELVRDNFPIKQEEHNDNDISHQAELATSRMPEV